MVCLSDKILSGVKVMGVRQAARNGKQGTVDPWKWGLEYCTAGVSITFASEGRGRHIQVIYPNEVVSLCFQESQPQTGSLDALPLWSLC
jgi:hypothetical protein